MQKLVPDVALQRSEADAMDEPLADARPVPGGHGVVRRLADGLERATDGQLALIIGAVLFLLAAWPVAMVQVPPLQDLPNHLATITVIEHPSSTAGRKFVPGFDAPSTTAGLSDVGRMIENARV